jgi:hypothetical protein
MEEAKEESLSKIRELERQLQSMFYLFFLAVLKSI